MIVRRVLLLVLALLVGVAVVADRSASDPLTPDTYGIVLEPSTPAVVLGDTLSTSWFCPGGPTDEGRTTGLTIGNPGDAVRQVRLTVYPSAGEPVVQVLDLAPRTRQTFDLGTIAPPAPASAATVEVYGDGVLVEQTVRTDLGASIAPCATAASPEWYLADGRTTIDASLSLLLFNPFAQDVLVDLSFATTDRLREPPELQGVAVPARSVRVVSVGEVVQREETLSTIVRARQGRLVLGRFQTADTGRRRGVVAGPGSPTPGSNWWFADGDKAEGVNERLIVLNPNDVTAAVDIAFFPAAGFAPIVDPAATAVPGDPAATAVPADPAATAVPADPAATTVPGETTVVPDGSAATSSSAVASAGSSGTDGSTTAPATTAPALPTDAATVVSLEVPPGAFRVVDVPNTPEIGTGRHSALVSVEGDDTPVVVERVLSRVRDDRTSTTVLLGARLATERWYVMDPLVSANGVLTVMNGAGLPTTLTVASIGPAGPVPVPGLEELPVPAGGVLEVGVPPSVGGLPLLVTAAGPVVVEWRALPGGDTPGLVGSLGVPLLG